MRLNSREILPALFAALFMLLAFQPASTAQDIQATPILEPAENETNPASMAPMANGEPTVTYTHSDGVYGLPDAQYHFTVNWDMTGVDFGVPDEDVSLNFEFNGSQSSTSIADSGRVSSLSIVQDQTNNSNLSKLCVQNQGTISGTMTLSANNTQNGTTIDSYDSQAVNIPCSVNITPIPPIHTTVCGPGNDDVTIPRQTFDLAVEITNWADNERTVTFPTGDWIIYPTGFDPIITYPDTGNCAITDAPTLPQMSTVCGENNDTITPAWSQAEGIDLVPVVSDWSNGQATLTYSALDGYFFPDEINNEIVVTDSGSGECITDLTVSVEEGAFENVSVGETVDVTVTATVPDGHSLYLPQGTFYSDRYADVSFEYFDIQPGVAGTDSVTFEYLLTNGVKNNVCDDGFITLTPILINSEDSREFLGDPVTYPCSFQAEQPSVSYDHPDSIYGLTGADYYFSIRWNVTDVDFENTYGVSRDNVSFTGAITLTDLTGSDSTTRSLSEYGDVNEIPFDSGGSFNEQLALNCVTNNGRIKGEMSFTAYNNQTTEAFYEAASQTFDIPCSVNLSPDTPTVITDVCGPGNDAITIPALPYGLSVNDTDWGNNTRTITFPTEIWIVYPDGFETSYPFTDTEDCDASITFSHPDSMYLIQQDTQVPVGAEYDISAIWSEEDPTSVRIWGKFSSRGVQFAAGSAIDNPVGSIDHTSTFQPGVVADLCIRGNGELELTVVAEFSHPSGEDWIIFWSPEETRTVPCSVAVTPAQATVNQEVCGYIDERINVPTQAGIASHEITWNGNVATITYEAVAPYEIVGGPFNVEVTADSCITDQVPDPGHIEQCGIENDDVWLGSPVKGVRYDTSEVWTDGVFYIWVSALPGWELPEGTETEWEIVDPGNCEIEGLTAPIHTEVCGENNDPVDLPAEQDHLTITATGDMATDGTVTVTLTPDENYMLPVDVKAEYTFTDKGNCEIEGLTAPIHTEVCGVNNDTVDLPAEQDHLTITTTGDMATDGAVTITITPDDGYVLPDGFQAEYTFTDAGDCIVTPIPPGARVAVCGPNNDILTIPIQPDGVIIEDSDWVDNERTLELIAEDGYAFPENTPRTFTSNDKNIDCEGDIETTTLVVTFETSDGGSLEGETFSLAAASASQVTQGVYIQGEIGPGNQIVIEDLIAGTYRLVASPEGYEPIAETITIVANQATVEHIVAVAAVQPAETPTPVPTIAPTVEPTTAPTIAPTVEPTIEPTTEPTTAPTIEPTSEATPSQVPADPEPTPTQESAPVSGLPSTGAGSGGGFGILALVGLLAAMVLGAIANQRRT